MRVPVISKDGKPLMPTKPAKARKMIRGGVAKKCWSKTGTFYIQMLIPVGEEVQDMFASLSLELAPSLVLGALAIDKM